jgi:hypothetical protein
VQTVCFPGWTPSTFGVRIYAKKVPNLSRDFPKQRTAYSTALLHPGLT